MHPEVAGGPRRRGRTRSFLRLLPSPRSTPFTFWYLGVLGLTTIVLLAAPPARRRNGCSRCPAPTR